MTDRLIEAITARGYLPIAGSREGLVPPGVFLKRRDGVLYLGSLGRLVGDDSHRFTRTSSALADFDAVQSSTTDLHLWARMSAWLSGVLGIEQPAARLAGAHAHRMAFSIRDVRARKAEIDEVIDVLPDFDPRLFARLGRNELLVAFEYLEVGSVVALARDGGSFSSDALAEISELFNARFNLDVSGQTATRMIFSAANSALTIGLRGLPIRQTDAGIVADVGRIVPSPRAPATLGPSDRSTDEAILDVLDDGGTSPGPPIDRRVPWHGSRRPGTDK